MVPPLRLRGGYRGCYLFMRARINTCPPPVWTKSVKSV